MLLPKFWFYVFHFMINILLIGLPFAMLFIPFAILFFLINLQNLMIGLPFTVLRLPITLQRLLIGLPFATLLLPITLQRLLIGLPFATLLLPITTYFIKNTVKTIFCHNFIRKMTAGNIQKKSVYFGIFFQKRRKFFNNNFFGLIGSHHRDSPLCPVVCDHHSGRRLQKPLTGDG